MLLVLALLLPRLSVGQALADWHFSRSLNYLQANKCR